MLQRLPFAAPRPFDALRAEYYAAILADPPWRFANWSDKGKDRCPDAPTAFNNQPERHYKTMPLEKIMALPVRELAARDCALFLYAIDSMLPQAYDVGRSWGFEFKTVAFYWVKLRKEGSKRGADQIEWDKKLFPIGTGYWTRPNPEQCLLFTRGEPRRRSTNVRKLIVAPRREHSRKPDETAERIEKLVDGPYVELFARTARDGWSAWGDQINSFPRAT
jgi:N6-adenosine-specific RNA methylase IME4